MLLVLVLILVLVLVLQILFSLFSSGVYPEAQRGHSHYGGLPRGFLGALPGGAGGLGDVASRAGCAPATPATPARYPLVGTCGANNYSRRAAC